MSEIERIEGRFEGRGRRFGIVASRFNSRIVDLLLAGAASCLKRHGVEAEAVRVIRVPGAWEVPLALEELAATKSYDALIALGTVIRGETPHFDYVAGECVRGVADVGRRYRVPVGFGILTCDTSEQAVERAGGKAGNKGWEAAMAALEMADLLARLRED